MGLSNFELRAGAGDLRLAVDGVAQEMTGVRRISVDSPADGVPVLYVEVIAEGVIQGEAIIRERVVPLDGIENTIRFLGNLDAGELEREVLNTLEPGESTGQAFLRVLRRWASGD